MEKVLNYTLTLSGAEPQEILCGGSRGEHKATALVLSPSSELSEAVSAAESEGASLSVKLDVVTEAGEIVEGEERQWEKLSDPFYLTSAMTASGLDVVVLVRVLMKDDGGCLIRECYKAQIKLFFQDTAIVGLVTAQKRDRSKELDEKAKTILNELQNKGDEIEQKIELKLKSVGSGVSASAEQLKKTMAFAKAAQEAATSSEESKNAAELSYKNCENTEEQVSALVQAAGHFSNEASRSLTEAQNARSRAEDWANKSENLFSETAVLAEEVKEQTKVAAEKVEQCETYALAAEHCSQEAEELLKATEKKVSDLKQANALFANALKGQAEGTTICMADISPVGHTLSVGLGGEGITDYSSEKVSVQGKNLLNVNGFELVGKTTAAVIYRGYLPKEFVFSWKQDFYAKNSASMFIITHLETGTVANVSGMTNKYNGDYFNIRRIPYDGEYEVKIVNWAADTGHLTELQIELGTVATEYEPYIEPVSYTANAEGVVEGIKSIYPTMTISADTKSIKVICEYNRDISKAFAELKAAIISLGGNV